MIGKVLRFIKLTVYAVLFLVILIFLVKNRAHVIVYVPILSAEISIRIFALIMICFLIGFVFGAATVSAARLFAKKDKKHKHIESETL